MKIVVAPNAFKESLDAPGAADAIASGLRAALPGAEIVLLPIADGGDGTAATLHAALGGARIPMRVTGPLVEPVGADLISLESNQTCVVEMAKTSGLALVPRELRNPMKTTTRGLGEMIARARASGAARIIVGVGGSATVDGAAGAAQALGFRLLDAGGRDIPPGGDGLLKLRRIEPSAAWFEEPRPRVVVASDVGNPLLGPTGAAAVFGPQKGATAAMIPKLEAGLANLAEILERDVAGPFGTCSTPLAELWGAGAAGGAGAGLAGFLGAEIRPGAEFILEVCGFAAKAAGADWVVTGEGRLDRQSLAGKAPVVVARAARALGARAIALAGWVDPEFARDPKLMEEAGLTACFSIASGPATLKESMARTGDALAVAAYQIGRMIAAAATGRLNANARDESCA